MILKGYLRRINDREGIWRVVSHLPIDNESATTVLNVLVNIRTGEIDFRHDWETSAHTEPLCLFGM